MSKNNPDQTTAAGVPKTCRRCGADLGQVMALEHQGRLVHVLKVGNQYILDERAICSVCLTPTYWNTSISQLQRLIELVTGQEITAEELEHAPTTP